MKAVTVLIQVALVAAGIFVYDQFRSDSPAQIPVDELELPPDRIAIRPRERDEVAPIILEGSGTEALLHRLEMFEERLDAIERVVDEGGRAARVVKNPDGTPYSPARVGQAGGGHSDEDIAWFRGVKAEVEQLERRERYVKMLERQLDHVGVILTDDQRRKVVDATIIYKDEIRAKVVELQRKGVSRDDQQTALKQMKITYDQTIYRLTPSSEAQRIVDVLGKYPGYGVPRPGIDGRR